MQERYFHILSLALPTSCEAVPVVVATGLTLCILTGLSKSLKNFF